MPSECTIRHFYFFFPLTSLFLSLECVTVVFSFVLIVGILFFVLFCPCVCVFVCVSVCAYVRVCVVCVFVFVYQVLSMQRIEEGRLVLENHPFSLRQMIQSTLRSFAAPLHEKHLQVQVILPSLDEFILQHIQKQQVTLEQNHETYIDIEIEKNESTETNGNTTSTNYATDNTNLGLNPASNVNTPIPPIGWTPSVPVTTLNRSTGGPGSASGSSPLNSSVGGGSNFGIASSNVNHPSITSQYHQNETSGPISIPIPLTVPTSTNVVQSSSSPSPPSSRSSSLPRWCVQGDLYRLRQVLANFLSNAIKLSPVNGKIIVALSIANLRLHHKFYQQFNTHIQSNRTTQNPTTQNTSVNLNPQPNNNGNSIRQTTATTTTPITTATTTTAAQVVPVPVSVPLVSYNTTTVDSRNGGTGVSSFTSPADVHRSDASDLPANSAGSTAAAATAFASGSQFGFDSGGPGSSSSVPSFAPSASVNSCLPVLGEAEFRLSVRDFGPGIAEADQANLFQGNPILHPLHLLFLFLSHAASRLY